MNTTPNPPDEALKRLLPALLLLCCCAAAGAAGYTKRHVMIPMRDGISLYTNIYEPSTPPPGGSPILIMRTPYSLAPYNDNAFSAAHFGLDSIYLAHGYILVEQNVRGTYLSEGEFEQVRPFNARRRKAPTDEATDVYDTVEWLLRYCRSNGRVGVKGTSYPGFYATVAACSGHPAVRAVSPQAPVCDWFMGDDIHHNGAFMLADSYSFGASFFRRRPSPRTTALPPLASIDTAIAVYYRRPIAELLLPLADSVPFWRDIVAHPNYDAFWRRRKSTAGAGPVAPAVMVVGGLYDAEDCYGAWETWRGLRARSPRTEVFLVQAPWYHHAWSNDSYQQLGCAWFGTGSARYFIRHVEYPFFAYYLEGRGRKPAAVTLLPSAETAPEKIKDRPADDRWQRLDSWPPRGAETMRFYLEGGTVTADPLHPVPYYNKGNGKKRDKNYMAADQRFASSRPDVLTCSGPILTDTLSLMGPVDVSLQLRASCTDLDAVVKLIDVRPDGCQLLVRGDVMPARFRRSFRRPQPVRPGKDFVLRFRMPDVAHLLLPGHRLMVQVQFSWYPLVAVNPQTFLPNPYKAQAGDYRPARIVLVKSKKSCLTLTVKRN